MDSFPSKQQKDKHNIGQPYTSDTPEYEMYTNEKLTKQRDVTRKKVLYRKGLPTEEKIPGNSFQIPESDNIRRLPTLDDSFRKSPKYGVKKYPEQAEDPSWVRKRKNPEDIYRGTNFSPNPSKYGNNSLTKNQMLSNKKNEIPSFENEQITNEITYGQKIQPTSPNYQGTNKAESSESPGFNVDKNASLICKAINYDGKPVTVNDKVIRDKLVLSCWPRNYEVGSYLKKTSFDQSERIPQYVHPTSEIAAINNVNIQRADDKYQQNNIDQYPYTASGRSALARSNVIDVGNIGQGEHPSETEKQGEIYEQQYRAIQCKRYTRNFKVFLWGLFIINILLVLVGLSLLLLTIAHLLFRDYINIVIGHTGFVTWVWGAMALSLLIIFVGIYGIVTSITRARTMLIVYCITATILAILIVIFLLIYWLMHSHLKSVQHTSMTSTFHMYRCHRWVRTGWDDLQEKYQCCGVEARGDWNYIPPSCCNAETKYDKLACINHYIREDLAYNGGCRIKLEDYFTTMFLLITCLLVLALILLLLGILAALRLLKMYKVILLCRDMFLITP